VLGLALLVPAPGCGRSEGEPAAAASRPAPAVTVTPVLRTRLPDLRERVGQLRAVEDVELRARVSGFLQSRLVEDGTDVEEGQLLFVIERAPYETEVQRTKAELARAQAALQQKRLDLSRTKTLRARNVASQASLDAAVAAEAQAAAEVLAAEALLREAELDLEYTEIYSPVNGRIGLAAFSVGDLVGPESGPLATVVSIDPIFVYWQVPEAVLLGFRRGQAERRARGEQELAVTAGLRFSDGSRYEHDGVWDFLDNRVDPTTGTQTARARFPNPDGLLLPGQYAEVIVSVGGPREALVVPQSAVQEDQAGRFVLVVDADDLATRRRVELGARAGIWWEVRSGLTEGERVIYQGIQKARPGSPVKPMELRPEPPDGT
jgi:membrane fusion protein (multidrug efflux system)